MKCKQFAVATATILLFLPSFSKAQPNKPKISPAAEKIINEAADIVFGKNQTAPPLIDLKKIRRRILGGDPRCPDRYRVVRQLRPNSPVAISADVICSNDIPLDNDVIDPVERDHRFSLKIIYNLTSDLSKPPLLRYSAQRYTRGYFGTSGNHCQLWLAHNSTGQINLAIIRMAAKGPSLYSVDDGRQRECFVRSKLGALGLQGGSDLPFERLAYQRPFPVGLHMSATWPDRMRIQTKILVNLIFLGIPEQAFGRLTSGPIRRNDFVAALTTSPKLEQVVSDLAHWDKVEKQERSAKAGPKLEPPSAPPATSILNDKGRKNMEDLNVRLKHFHPAS